MQNRGFQKDTGNEILSEINVIPLVDISLVLLIIFMVTANYIMTPTSVIDVPQAKHGKSLQASKQINIYIKKDGVIYLEKEPVVADELIDELQAFKQKNSDTKIVLHADKLVQFKYVAKALDAVSSVDISNFNIAVEKSEE